MIAKLHRLLLFTVLLRLLHACLSSPLSIRSIYTIFHGVETLSPSSVVFQLHHRLGILSKMLLLSTLMKFLVLNAEPMCEDIFRTSAQLRKELAEMQLVTGWPKSNIG